MSRQEEIAKLSHEILAEIEEKQTLSLEKCDQIASLVIEEYKTGGDRSSAWIPNLESEILTSDLNTDIAFHALRDGANSTFFNTYVRESVIAAFRDTCSLLTGNEDRALEVSLREPRHRKFGAGHHAGRGDFPNLWKPTKQSASSIPTLALTDPSLGKGTGMVRGGSASSDS